MGLILPATTINWGQPVNRACPLNRGLVGWWLPTPQNKGVVFRDVAGINNGTLTNMDPGSDWVPSGNGSELALDLDGSNDYSIGSTPVTGAVPFSFDVWFKTTSTAATFRAAFGLGNSATASRFALFRMENGGTHRLQYNVGGATTTANFYMAGTINDGNWHHAVGVVAATNNHAAYLDGKSGGTSSTDTGTLTFDRACIGAWNNGSSTPIQFFPGQVRSARVWNRALSADEASRLYVDGRQGHPLTLNRNSRVLAYQPAAGGVTIPVFRHHYQMQGVA